MKITLNDLAYSFKTPTTFSLKKVLILATENITVYPILNGYHLISIPTNQETEVYLEPITSLTLAMEVKSMYDIPVNVLSVELEIE